MHSITREQSDLIWVYTVSRITTQACYLNIKVRNRGNVQKSAQADKDIHVGFSRLFSIFCYIPTFTSFPEVTISRVGFHVYRSNFTQTKQCVVHVKYLESEAAFANEKSGLFVGQCFKIFKKLV